MSSDNMKQYDSFSTWKKDQSGENQQLITEVARLVSNIAPELKKTVKWGQGCWTEGRNHKLFVHCKPDHIQLGFYKGSQLNDPHKLLQGTGKYVKHIKVFSSKDIDTKAFSALIEQVL